MKVNGINSNDGKDEKMINLTEDEVRNSAGGILGFTIIGENGEMINVENDIELSGVGQLTTFN